MITQEKMYEVMFDNKEYVYYIINNHFKKAEPNEKTYKTMLKNNIYFNFLCSINSNLTQEKEIIIRLLNSFKNKFWLKKDTLTFLTMVKLIKLKQLTFSNATKIVPQFKIVNGFYEYLNLISTKTNINEKVIDYAAQVYEEEGINQAIKYIIKNKLVH